MGGREYDAVGKGFKGFFTDVRPEILNRYWSGGSEKADGHLELNQGNRMFRYD